MSDIENCGLEMSGSIFDFISTLQNTKKIKLDVFQEIEKSSEQLARLLRGSEMLPRKWLYELDMAAGILEAEALHSSNQALLCEMASKLRVVFGLIISGECIEDRKPGVMRIK